jgi:hypothetical protein
MASVASGPFLVVCALLAWSGAVKIARPDAAREAARAAGLPARDLLVRVFGAVELGVAIVGVVAGSYAACAVALVYIALTAIAARLLHRAPVAPCGCFGTHSPTISRAHVVFNAVAALVAVAAAFSDSPLARIEGVPLAALSFVVLVACAVRLAAALLDGAITTPSSGGVR